MSDGAPRPYTLVAELTYRCPLRCVYCSNPLDYASHRDALGTADWLRVFREAEALGVVQLHLTGGEPLVRDDLEAMVEAARGLQERAPEPADGARIEARRFAERRVMQCRGHFLLERVAGPPVDG